MPWTGLTVIITVTFYSINMSLTELTVIINVTFYSINMLTELTVIITAVFYNINPSLTGLTVIITVTFHHINFSFNGDNDNHNLSQHQHVVNRANDNHDTDSRLS